MLEASSSSKNKFSVDYRIFLRFASKAAGYSALIFSIIRLMKSRTYGEVSLIACLKTGSLSPWLII